MEENLTHYDAVMDIAVVSANDIFIHYSTGSDFYMHKYLGEIKEKYFYAEQKNKIKNKEVSQFMFIHEDFNTVFNYKQVKQLKSEIELIEEEGIFSKGTFDLIKEGIKMVLENKDKNLYLKFEYA